MRAVAVLALALLAGCHDPAPAPELNGLAVSRGAPFHLADQRGKVVLVSFGYTSCLEVCPVTFSIAKHVLGDLGPDVEFVYVTVDPERDRPDVLGPFLRSVDPRFEGIFAEGPALQRILDDYHITVRKRVPDPTRYARRKESPSAFYAMDHTAGFWGIDRRGRLRFHLDHDADSSAVESATRALVQESPPARVHVENAFAQLAPAGTGAVYLDLVNDADGADRLVGVESKLANDAQLHELVTKGGLSSMHELDAIDLPAHRTVHLARGAKHIMLLGYEPTGAGEIPLTLHFEHAPALAINVTIRPMSFAGGNR